MDYTNIAESILFGTVKTEADLLKKIGGQAEYRKGKKFSDVHNALQKALNQKTYKTELEVSWFALYLKDVFKPVKPTLVSLLLPLSRQIHREEIIAASDFEIEMAKQGFSYRANKGYVSVQKAADVVYAYVKPDKTEDEWVQDLAQELSKVLKVTRIKQ